MCIDVDMTPEGVAPPKSQHCNYQKSYKSTPIWLTFVNTMQETVCGVQNIAFILGAS